MKVATTIQITADENRQIDHLKKSFGFRNKKAVVLEGLKALARIQEDLKRRERLSRASLLVRSHSIKANQSWSPLSTAIKTK